MKVKKVKFITFGCKVNQYETQSMREAMERSGVCSVREDGPSPEVDFVVINTCTVTHDADRENRYWIRRARRDYPNARIVVTGCAVERDREKICLQPEVDLIVSNQEKAGIAERLAEGCAAPAVQASAEEDRASAEHRYMPLFISHTEGNGRAFVKIQDGCNHACSFCKVVLVRGRSRSRPLEDILEEIKRLRDAGYREIVFAGIQLGAYGLDFSPRAVRLPEVLEASAKMSGIERLRLSSIEPTDVNASLVAALRDIPKCAPHLHIPLQSGDDEILKAMNRRYGRAFYIDLISRLKSELKHFFLTLDVMAGFPGEEERHFENTCSLLETVRPLKCHVFPYSRREGTRAAQWRDVAPEILRRRVNLLMALSDRLGREERVPYLGKWVAVLVEKKNQTENTLQGLTPNYLKVSLEGPSSWIGQIIPVELIDLENDLFYGTPQRMRETP